MVTTIEPLSAIPDTVETFELPSVLATLPIHIFTVIFIVIVMISIINTRHLHDRPQKLFAINCGFFLVASFYDLAFDIGYLVIVDRQISVQTCSLVRNFVYNPIAIQAIVDALERFSMAFFNYDMPVSMVFALYTLFPLLCVLMAFYNSFITSSLLQTDDVCAIVRRTNWTNIALIVIQWSSAAIAVLLYIAVWKKVKKDHNAKVPSRSTKDRDIPWKMASSHYYWDRHIVQVFFICCVLPLVLAVPSLVLTFLTELQVYQNSDANIIGIVILDLTTPITWMIYICYIEHIRNGLLDTILCKTGPVRQSISRTIESEHL